MLYSGTVRLHGLHVLVQDGKNLIVQDLVLPNSVCHLLQGHILNDLILPVLPLDFQQVVTEVKQVEATLLAQQDDDGAAGPVQTVTKTLLSCELVGPHGDAVDELHGTPEPVELHALVDVHDAIGGWWAPPDGVLQVAPNACQDDLKHGQATAQPLLGQQVALPSDGDLLGTQTCINLLSSPRTPSSTSHQRFPCPGAGCIWNSLTRVDVLPRAGHYLCKP